MRTDVMWFNFAPEKGALGELRGPEPSRSRPSFPPGNRMPAATCCFLAFPFGLAGGRYGWDLSAAGPEAAVDFALDELAGMFGSGVRKNLVKSHAAGWADKPSTLGAYAAAMPGHYSARVEFARPAGDRICFVGEAVAMSRVQLYDRSVHRPYGWRDDAMRTLSGWSSLRGRPAVHR